VLYYVLRKNTSKDIGKAKLSTDARGHGKKKQNRWKEKSYGPKE
jgi:hypothetical protein